MKREVERLLLSRLGSWEQETLDSMKREESVLLWSDTCPTCGQQYNV